jgi:RND family efflux transporter MFP subunit
MSDSVNTAKPNKVRRMVPLRYVLTPIAIVLTAIVLLIMVAIIAPKPAKKPIQVKAPLVDVIELSPKSVSFQISSQGSVLPRTETNLISEVSGNVVSVSEKFKVGGFFRKGEELLRIDDITYQVALLKAESQLDSAKADLEQELARRTQAHDEWRLTGKSVEEAPSLALRTPQLKQAQAAIKSAEASLTEAQTKLARTRILAPYDAMLKQKHVDIGQYVSTGSSIATTFAVDYAEIRLPIKQRDVDFLNLPKINNEDQSGSSVELFYELNGKNLKWSSRLTRYEGVVDMSSRVHYVVAQLDDPYGIVQGAQNTELRIGTFVNAQITGKTVDNLTAIPRAFIHGPNSLYLVDESNKLVITDVSVLRADVDFLYTLDALPENHRLVITNLATPVKGMTLRINGEEPAKAEAPVEDEQEQGDQS